jgi:hypothetical protein
MRHLEPMFQTGLGLAPCPWHNRRMSDTSTNIHPYSLEIIPPKADGGSYQWAIRKNGKLTQRSDRSLPSEAKARESGLGQIEKLLSGVGDR